MSAFERYRRLYLKEKGLVDSWNEYQSQGCGLLGTITNILERLPVRRTRGMEMNEPPPSPYLERSLSPSPQYLFLQTRP